MYNSKRSLNKTSSQALLLEFLVAVKSYDEDGILKCLEKGANINDKLSGNDTAIMLAIKNFSNKIGALFDDHNRDLLREDVPSQNALWAKWVRGSQEPTSGLEEYSQRTQTHQVQDEVNFPNLSAYFKKDVSLIKLLSVNGADINLLDDKGESPLFHYVFSLIYTLAITNLKNDVIFYEGLGFLLSLGANPSTQGLYGASPLLLMCDLPIYKDNYDAAIKLMIEKGADVNAGNFDGVTPLMLTAYNLNPEITEVLIKHGASKYARDKNGFTALDYLDPRFKTNGAIPSSQKISKKDPVFSKKIIDDFNMGVNDELRELLWTLSGHYNDDYEAYGANVRLRISKMLNGAGKEEYKKKTETYDEIEFLKKAAKEQYPKSTEAVSKIHDDNALIWIWDNIIDFSDNGWYNLNFQKAVIKNLNNKAILEKIMNSGIYASDVRHAANMRYDSLMGDKNDKVGCAYICAHTGNRRAK